MTIAPPASPPSDISPSRGLASAALGGRVGRDHRRRPARRLRHQDVPDPGVLHPVGVDGADAEHQRPGPRQQAQLPPPRRPPRRHRRVRAPRPRVTDPRSRTSSSGWSACPARRSRAATARVFVNGRRSTSPTSRTGQSRRPTSDPSRGPDGHVWVMGDNREQLQRQPRLCGAPESYHRPGLRRVWPLTAFVPCSRDAARPAVSPRGHGDGVDHAVDVVAVDAVDAHVAAARGEHPLVLASQPKRVTLEAVEERRRSPASSRCGGG